MIDPVPARSPSWSRLGAQPEPGGVRFTLWSPEASRIELLLESGPGARPAPVALEAEGEGLASALVAGAAPGTRYRYRVDGRGPFPDPASRHQPDGVHGPSEVIDPAAFAWSATPWRGRALEDLVLYELHVGTFTAEGTFRAAIARLPHLVDLGVTAVELMPLADFPGTRNWGYDGAALFAPARSYGRPDDLRALVDAAHRHGLAVHLDVVYNHLGPDGAYVVALSPILNRARRTEWGTAVNLDGPHSAGVREWLIRNALHWVTEYRLDGLRLDATQALDDASPRHFVAELNERLRAAVTDRPVVVIAEDFRNEPAVVRPVARGGWGCDAMWSFDWHHQAHVTLTGERAGYYVDHEPKVADLARVLERGWLFEGQHSRWTNRPRGRPPEPGDPARSVFYLQNHDEVGNRAGGERLHHLVEGGAWRAAVALTLLAPQTPLLFMGEEWAASTPFLFFTDHPEPLGARVTESRRRELADGGDPVAVALRPPQDVATFTASVLRWDELAREPHAGALRLHRALLALRRTHPSLRPGAAHRVAAHESAEMAAVLMTRDPEGAEPVLIVACLRGAGAIALPAGEWRPVLDTESAGLTTHPAPDRLDPGRRAVRFMGPGAVVLREVRRG
jgi:maltooligosyltrehalose trehalohydrolase